MKKRWLLLAMSAVSISALAGCAEKKEVNQEEETAYVGDKQLELLTDKANFEEKKVVAYEDRIVYQFDPEKETLVKDGVIEKGSSYLRPAKTGDTLLVGEENYDYVQFGNEMVLINAMESTEDLRETMAQE